MTEGLAVPTFEQFKATLSPSLGSTLCPPGANIYTPLPDKQMKLGAMEKSISYWKGALTANANLNRHIFLLVP